MPSQNEIRDEVTQRIIAALEADLLPWRRPWRATVGGSQPGRHSNVASKRPYQGVNPLLLERHALRLGLLSRWWATFNRFAQLGCRILSDLRTWKRGIGAAGSSSGSLGRESVMDKQTDDEGDEETALRPQDLHRLLRRPGGGGSGREVPGSRGRGSGHPQPDFPPAEELISATGADIRFGGDRAFYRRPVPAGTFPNHHEGDFIVLPPNATFDPPGAFYETALHELAHWSEVRTGWDHEKQGYALGELAAEIASLLRLRRAGHPARRGTRQPCRLPEELA